MSKPRFLSSGRMVVASAAMGSSANPFQLEKRYRDEILAVYFKCEEDFEDVEEYNEYLMEVEDMVHSLMNDENTPATRAKLAQYKKQYGELSAANRSRRAVAYRQMQEADERERLEREQRRLEQHEADERRLHGRIAEKRTAQISIAEGRGAATTATAAPPAASLTAELLVDPAAVPLHMREEKQETRQAPSRGRGATEEARAKERRAAQAAGYSQRLWLQHAVLWACQGDGLEFVPPADHQHAMTR